MASAYALHVKRWGQGCGSGICDKARSKVFARGTIPCDVLFVGEAPGPSENVLGRPFVGPAGHLLNKIVARALDGREVSCAYTNLVACIPLDDDGNKFHEPDEESVDCCSDRLRQFIALCKPKLIVAVGKLANDYLTPGYKHSVVKSSDWWAPIPLVHITHPASILRAQIANQGLMIQTCVVNLDHAISEHVMEHDSPREKGRLLPVVSPAPKSTNYNMGKFYRNPGKECPICNKVIRESVHGGESGNFDTHLENCKRRKDRS